MLSRAEAPWAGHLDGDTEGVTRESLNLSRGAAVAHIVDNETGKTHEALSSPDSNNTVQHKLLGALLQVNPYSTEGKRGTNDVAVQEDLVERVTDGGGRLKEEEGKCNGTLKVLALRRFSSACQRTMKPVMMNSLPVIDA